MSSENLLGPLFHIVALGHAYDIGSSIVTGMADYSRRTNIALYMRLQELSMTSEIAVRIIDLIFTDIATHLIMGMRSRMAVAIVQRVKLHALYGIPAYATLAVFILATVAFVVLAI
ncbi:hypothetical protein BJX63DRAFT_429859 [Aspergillus granulosus]|uniref:Uncharacterized protein n=1 Tax=Aspergillus granulosus TaxID=176169 RepID=A0ABR4HP59_9EURO